MRRSALLAAFSGVLALSAAVNAAYTVSSSRAASTTSPGYDAVRFYAFNTGTGTTAGTTGLLAEETTLTTTGLGGFKFFALGTTPDLKGAHTDFGLGTPTQPQGTYISVGNHTNFSVVDSSVTPPSSDPGYLTGTLKSFKLAGAQLGSAAAAPANTTPGALFAVALVPTGQSVTASGFFGTESTPPGQSGTIAYTITDSVGTVNTAPVVVSPVAPVPVVFGPIVSNGASFSVPITVTDVDVPAQTLTLTPGTLPAGITNVTVTPSSGTTGVVFTVSGTAAYSLRGTTVTVPFTVSDGAGGSTPSSFQLVVTPEPTTLAALAGAAGLGLIRRRK